MNYYNEIKEQLINNEIYKKVKDYSKNKSDLDTYYNVGKLLVEAQGGQSRARYGDKLIKEYSDKLTNELGRSFHSRILWRSRNFYLLLLSLKVSTMSTQLTWSHYVELLSMNNVNKINYYMNISIKQNLSVRQLREKIKNKEYERLGSKIIVNEENNKLEDYIKNPILIKNSYNYTDISEKILKSLILEDLPHFMKELGDGFCFIDSEYKIKIGDRYNYIDLLLFNIKYNCYIVIELKITELKKEHIGQIETYMNYIDKNIKTNQNKTIGIIIVKKDNKFIMEYVSNKEILSKEYILM